MKEELLHFIWKHLKFSQSGLHSVQGESLIIHHPGTSNFWAGPDFFDARISIDGQLWAGNVEIHTYSSHWYAHKHHLDPSYFTVILHVVWENDITVIGTNGEPVSTFELKEYVAEDQLEAYTAFLEGKNRAFINCERSLKDVPDIEFNAWLDRLFAQRLDRRCAEFEILLEHVNDDWEHLLFAVMLKSFGLNVNGHVFMQMGMRLKFIWIRKERYALENIEALLFGMAGLLDAVSEEDSYLKNLNRIYNFLSTKYRLGSVIPLKPEFKGLRPLNFPTIRLAQIAAVYHRHPSLFQLLVNLSQPAQFYGVFDTPTSSYWDTHYTFGKTSRAKPKKITRSFIDLLLLNSILPLVHLYYRKRGEDRGEFLMKIAMQMPAEVNTILSTFSQIGKSPTNACESQSLLEMYKWYCSDNRCLNCRVGIKLLSGK